MPPEVKNAIDVLKTNFRKVPANPNSRSKSRIRREKKKEGRKYECQSKMSNIRLRGASE